MTIENQRAPRQPALGAWALFAGIGLLVLCLIESQTGIAGLPRFWHQNQNMWWLFALGSLAGGTWLLAPVQQDPGTRWRPSRSGIRFRQVLVYSRAGCHLCDEAVAVLAQHHRWLPRITAIDVDTDPRLVEKFGTCVPVVVCDGKVRFRGRVRPELLHRLLEGTPPL